MTATVVRLSALVLLVSWCHPGAAGAQERFPRVQYVAGRPELLKPTEVTLVIEGRELRAEQTVYSDRGSSVRTAFTIPLTDIVAVGASPRGEADGLVLTGPFGVSSSSLNHDEYVTVTLQSGDRIDAVVFKVARQQSAAIAARIESAVDRALEPPSRPPAKARARSHRRPLRLVRVVGRPAGPARGRFRKLRARGRWRGAANRRSLERT